MKTKFLLHGGRLKLKDKRNDAYFQELTKELGDGDKVLFIGFAKREESDRAEVYEREKSFMLAQTDKKIEAVNATYDNLIQQSREAKAIHITGGELGLVEDMQKYPDFIKALSGKVIGGSSAGACLFSTYYFFSDELGVLRGLGTLPIALRVHSDNPEYGTIEPSIKLLQTYATNLELLSLEECDWVTREADL